MATIVSSSVPTNERKGREAGFIENVRGVWRQFILTAFDPYHPERHYMRGPGPACRRKQSE